MPQVGFEPTIAEFQRAKTVHALDRTAAVIGICGTYCGVFTQTVAKQRLRKHISTETLLSILSASRMLLRNAEVNTSLHCYASMLQLVDTQQWEMRVKFSVQSAQKLYNTTLVGHQTVLVQKQLQLSKVQVQESTNCE
jgi:hypothetical protein